MNQIVIPYNSQSTVVRGTFADKSEKELSTLNSLAKTYQTHWCLAQVALPVFVSVVLALKMPNTFLSNLHGMNGQVTK